MSQSSGPASNSGKYGELRKKVKQVASSAIRIAAQASKSGKDQTTKAAKLASSAMIRTPMKANAPKSNKGGTVKSSKSKK